MSELAEKIIRQIDYANDQPFACDADREEAVEIVDEHLSELKAEIVRQKAEVQEAVQALFAFTQIRWFANTQEKSDDVRRAVEFVKKHDPERWAAYMAENHPF